MPNIKSAKKRVKVIRTKTLRNRRIKSELKTYIKKTTSAIEAGDKVVAIKELSTVTAKLDRAGAKGVMHKNTIARRKSKLAKKLNKISG